jgi:hypothetical protein
LLQAAKKKLDLVYVSHIDRDHISGVLQMLDDEVDWRVHGYQLENGNPTHPAPSSVRPPKIRRIWHNAFHEQIGRNAGPIGDALAASGALLSAADAETIRNEGAVQSGIAQSIPEAIKVSRRIGAGQLKIPLNAEFGGKLATVEGDSGAVSLGSTKLEVIGPFGTDLTKLRTEWNAWLRTHGDALRTIERRAGEDEESLGTSSLAWPASHFVALGNALGTRSKVTTPNLASLMVAGSRRCAGEGRRVVPGPSRGPGLGGAASLRPAPSRDGYVDRTTGQNAVTPPSPFHVLLQTFVAVRE